MLHSTRPVATKFRKQSRGRRDQPNLTALQRIHTLSVAANTYNMLADLRQLIAQTRQSKEVAGNYAKSDNGA